MTNTLRQTQIEFGDFQTPLELAKRVCQKLNELGVSPVTVIEPTCGLAHLLKHLQSLSPTQKNYWRRSQQGLSGRIGKSKKAFFSE